MYTKEDVLILLCALIQLRIGVIKNIIPRYDCGICTNVTAYGGDESLLPMFYYKCKSFSGDNIFPVIPGNIGYNIHVNDKWVGEYGKARIKFLDELIMIIEMDIEEGKYET